MDSNQVTYYDVWELPRARIFSQDITMVTGLCLGMHHPHTETFHRAPLLPKNATAKDSYIAVALVYPPTLKAGYTISRC